MSLRDIKPLSTHYSFTDVPSVYDEEALTALELCGRTTKKINEIIEEVIKAFEEQNLTVNDTLKLLVAECEKHQLTIDSAVDYMKDNLTESAEAILYEIANAGDIGILEQAHYEQLRKNITTVVNVKEYGAKGDGLTDDTLAIKQALDAGVNIYFPAGAYIVSEPITLAKYYHIYGEGAEHTTVTFKGVTDTYLFVVSTMYNDRPTIEGLGFVGMGHNGFMLCSASSWGGSVHLNNINVKDFGINLMRFESVFMCTVENSIINTSSMITFDTYNGTYEETNFSNCVTLKNCLFVGSQTQRFIALRLRNVRLINFVDCVFENINTLVASYDKTQTVKFTNCWFENITTLAECDPFSGEPVLDNCNPVNVGTFMTYNYDPEYNVFDRMEGAPYIKDLSGQPNTMTSALTVDNVTLACAHIYNPQDVYAHYYTPYSIRTDRALFNMPLNLKSEIIEYPVYDTTPKYFYFVANDGTERLPSCAGYYKVKIIFNYSDASYIIHELEFLRESNGYVKKLHFNENTIGTWSGCQALSATVETNLVDIRGGAISYRSVDAHCIRTEAFVEWNLLGF